jgi:DNA-binding MarR family transcriptional regulator
MTLNELATMLNLDNSTMSRTVNNLVKKDLAQRITDQNDRRYITISLTNQGQAEFESIESVMDSYYDKVYQDIPENKREQLIDSINVLIKALEINER